MEDIYPFVYKGILTDASLDKAGRMDRRSFGAQETALLRDKLSFDMLDDERLQIAGRMAVVYTAIHSFENMVRGYVKSTLIEEYEEDWWSKVPEKVKSKVSKRMEDDAKFRWHGTRGISELDYCDFGDLSSIIVTNREIFEPTLSDIEWAKSVLGVLERSRNIVMHGGSLDVQDIERIGGNIRDWVRQAG